tara:strand:+ start:1068 stop:1235 length:168 start_codon:yes stop_codon:yes gene_type:complete
MEVQIMSNSKNLKWYKTRVKTLEEDIAFERQHNTYLEKLLDEAMERGEVTIIQAG